MELINVIEISPYDYSINEYKSPNGTSSEFPDKWNAFWLKCISDKNLGNLKAIKKGSYLFEIQTINEYELEEILNNKLKDEDFEEQVSRLLGGIVVRDNQILLIDEPTCCEDIGNIKEWESILRTRLRIGHNYRLDILGFFIKKTMV